MGWGWGEGGRGVGVKGAENGVQQRQEERVCN